MAHFIKRKRFKRKHYPERLSRIPFNEESIEPYRISPSTMSLEADLLIMLNKVINVKKGCIDGQNGNIYDNFIKSWEDLAKSSLEKQKTEHIDKIQTIANVRKAIRLNAQDWIEHERDELKKINEKVIQVEKDYKDFCSKK